MRDRFTGPKQDDLVFDGQLGEVGDVLGPLDELEELLVGRLANARHARAVRVHLRLVLAFDALLGSEHPLDGHIVQSACRRVIRSRMKPWVMPRAHPNTWSRIHIELALLLVALALFLHGFALHAHLQAFLVAAVLAPVTLALVDQALAVLSARVRQVFADGSLEEPFAPCKQDTE